jgi:hypothetical protein
MNSLHNGNFGTIYEITDPRRNEQRTGTLEAWLLNLPGAHPLWAWFMLYVIHLRDEEGLPPAEKITPEMTHQLVFVALDPVLKPDPANLKTMVRLTPSNYIEQFAVASDENAIELGFSVAKALADGRLIAEPSGIMGARELMKNFIAHLVKRP